MTTTYGYDATTGELRTLTYNDTGEAIPTPPVSYTYTRLGQLSTVADAIGTRNFNYDSSTPWRLSNEAFPSFYGSRQLGRLYEGVGSGGTWHGYTTALEPGRADGFNLGISTNTSRDLHEVLTFSDQQRLVGVTGQIGTATGQDFVYSYTASSSLLNGYTAGSNFVVSRTYETARDLMTRVQSVWGSTTLTQYDIAYNNLAQRVTARQSGTAFGDYYPSGTGYSGVYNVYQYDARGELQRSAMYGGDTPTTSPTTSELPGRHFEYRYDSIGNRTTAGENGSASSNDDQYVTNNLNQYTSKQNNVVRVVGTAAATANVAVSGAPVTGKVDHAWGADLVPPNQSTAAGGTATIYAGIPGTGGAADRFTSTTKQFLVGPVSQALTYDADGNLTDDVIWHYTYDAENRLVAMQNNSAAIGTNMITSANARRLVFAYDYMGRRVQKQVFGGYTSGSYPTSISNTKFLYDAWNPIAEMDGSSTNLTRTYTWGLDLTGSLTQTAGVGGLLQMYDYTSTNTYWPTYDGNGNVASLVNAASGSFAAVYEYDPFGNPLRADVQDSVVQNNPFRFSTRYTDVETGLVYYGLRYYNATLGRFIYRDPAQESGGANLYGFVINNAISGIDLLGLDHWERRMVCQPDGHGGSSCHWVDVLVLDPFYVNETRDHNPPPSDPNPGDSNTSNGGNSNGSNAGGNNRGGGNTPTTSTTPSAPNKPGKQAPLDLLKKLCGTEAGRALVDALRNGSRNVREVSSDLLSPSLQTATSMTAGTSNEAAGVIYLFPGNYANLANTLANSRFNYRGSAADFGASTLIHENLHFNNPAPPGTVPAGQAGRYEEALVRQMTDSQLPGYGLPQIFGLNSFQGYLGTVPNQGTNLSTGKATSDYGQKATNSTMSQLDAASSELSGWDCSRVK